MFHEDVPDLSRMEAALAGLTPVPARVDRDRLMFQAGQAGARNSPAWPIVSGILGVATAALVIVVLAYPRTRVVERVVYVSPPPAPTSPEQAPVAKLPTAQPPAIAAWFERSDDLPYRNPYEALEEQLLRWGLDGLPDVTPGVPSEPPVTVDSLLGVPAERDKAPSWFPLSSWFPGRNES